MNAAKSAENHLGAILIVGGVRSGKSRFAQNLAERIGGNDVLFVATAQPGDDEMIHRIQHHRQSRPAAWRTIESPTQLARRIDECREPPTVILVDCLTILVSNILCESKNANNELESLHARVESEIDELADVAANKHATLVMVSGEVGCGVVPEHPLGRTFRDLLGRANQKAAAIAASTYWMVAGLPIDATKLADTLDEAVAKVLSRRQPEGRK